MLVLAYAIYFLLPWLPWSRLDAPAQAVLFDLPGRRFLIFGLTVYPQDVIWLALLLFIAAILLFFVTGLVGRAFCGYFCFQTLWTDSSSGSRCDQGVRQRGVALSQRGIAKSTQIGSNILCCWCRLVG